MINKVKKLIKMIIKRFIMFQTLLFLAYIEKYLDKYPIKKKNKKEAIDAPIPKNIFWLIIKSFEKFPKKNTVSEYTWGFKYVNPRVFKKILKTVILVKSESKLIAVL